MRSKSLKDFKVIIASDVDKRDGIGIEIWDWEESKILIEIFRDDENEDYTISLYEEGLPLNLIEECIERFRKEIPSVFQK